MRARLRDIGTQYTEVGQWQRRGSRGRWCIAGTLLFAACSASGLEEGEERVIVSSEAVHVVGTSEVIARVADLQPMADGRVWVLNSTAPLFVVFGPDGVVEHEFGQSGGGPAEFGAPVAFVDGPAGDVWTFDVTRYALIRLPATKRRDLRFPADSLPRAALVSFAGAGLGPARPWLESGSGGFLLARTRPGGGEPFSGLGFWNADIVRVRPDSPAPVVEVHTPLADLLGDPASRYAGATKFLPYPLWTVCADGTVALYDPLENELRRLGANGRALTSVALPEERRVELTFDRLFGTVHRHAQENWAQLPDSADMRKEFSRAFSELESQFASVFPEYANLHCTRDGTLWIQPFDAVTGALGRGSNWHRISRDGSRTRVTFPEAFRPFRFEADRIWGTAQDSLGVASVAWIGNDALSQGASEGVSGSMP